FLACGKVVENHDAFAAADEFIHGVRPDEAGAAGNQVSHANHPPNRRRVGTRLETQRKASFPCKGLKNSWIAPGLFQPSPLKPFGALNQGAFPRRMKKLLVT